MNSSRIIDPRSQAPAWERVATPSPKTKNERLKTMKSLTNPYRRCDGVTRRDVLRVGGLTALGLGIGDILKMRRASAANGSSSSTKAKSCILIWLDGGPSHLETFDLKPDAPKEVRGPLAPISTNLPGVQISECLPKLAQRMDKIAVIRSMTSPLGEHNFGTHYLLTGYKPTPVLDYPAFHAVSAHLRAARGILPANIAIPEYRVGGGRFNGEEDNPCNGDCSSADHCRTGFTLSHAG